MYKITLNKKYKPLFTSESRYFICTGGRGSSKSFSITSWILMLMLAESGHTILFARYTLKSANISIIPEFLEKIEILGVQDKFNITKDSIECKITGSTIIFKGIRTSTGDNTAALKSLNGVTTLVIDESEELTDEKIFDKINLSIRQKGRQNRVILILNPTTKDSWIYNRFFANAGVNPGYNGTKGNTTYIHTDYRDNIKNLDSSFVYEVENIKATNPDKYEHTILGGWRHKADGVIFTNWKIGEFDSNLEYGFGLDFGFSIDPTALVKVAIDKKLKKIYLKQELYQSHLTTSEIYSKIKGVVLNKEIIADNAEGRLIEELKRLGLNIKPCKKGAGSVVDGVTLMQDYEIIIDEDSIDLIKEFNNYTWSNKKAGQPIDMYNHAIDSSRYRIAHILKQGAGGSIR